MSSPFAGPQFLHLLHTVLNISGVSSLLLIKNSIVVMPESDSCRSLGKLQLLDDDFAVAYKLVFQLSVFCIILFDSVTR